MHATGVVSLCRPKQGLEYVGREEEGVNQRLVSPVGLPGSRENNAAACDSADSLALGLFLSRLVHPRSYSVLTQALKHWMVASQVA